MVPTQKRSPTDPAEWKSLLFGVVGLPHTPNVMSRQFVLQVNISTADRLSKHAIKNDVFTLVID